MKKTVFDRWSNIDGSDRDKLQPSNRELMGAIVYFMKDGPDYTTFFEDNLLYKYVMKHIIYPQFGKAVDIHGKWSQRLVNVYLTIKWLTLLILGNAIWDLIKYLFS